MPSDYNEVVAIALDGTEHIVTNAPGDPGNGTMYRAERIANTKMQNWICKGGVVLPAHGVARIEVREAAR